jgi:hypothetical protein
LIAAPDMTAAHGVPLGPPARAAALRERLLLIVLFVTVLTSSVAFIEPSPHDALMGVLLVTALVAGVRLERALVVPFLLLLIWNLGGLIALLHVPGQEKTLQYAATSLYLAVAALLFAGLFAHNTLARLTTMRVAYIITAVAASFLGMAGYFDILGTGPLFAPIGRAAAAFKDPNVYGPFLIWPALFLLDRMVARRIRFIDAVVVAILLFGLLLSFSRGAWFHFAVSAMVMVGLAFVTAPNARQRLRVIGLAGAGLVALVLFVLFLLSFDSIYEMFRERAHLLQYYDVGSGGRFRLQELALGAVLKYPNGMGPFEFARVHGVQQHNVYLQAFLVYGWVGAMAYILLLISTVMVGLRTAFLRTPWQSYAITALAAFVGEMAEGFVIDSDHWRHFYLLLGMIWGMFAASFRQAREQRMAAPPALAAGLAR